MHKRFVFWLVIGGMLYGAVELSSLLGLYLLKTYRYVEYAPPPSLALSEKHQQIIRSFIQGKTRYSKYSASLGWTIKENGVAPLYRANSQGIRGDHTYARQPDDGVIRISSFGDSYTHCDDVANDDTWQVQLQRLGSDLEVLNFGIGGFGLDQAFLRYREEAQHFTSQIVLIGYMTENIFRHVNVFRPFYLPATGTPLSKPRFLLQGGKLKLLENPMRKLSDYEQLLAHPEAVLPVLGGNDYFFNSIYKSSRFDVLPSYRLVSILSYLYLGNREIIVDGAYNTESEAFQITERLLDEFYHSVQQDHALPIILIFPEPADIVRFRNDGTKQYDALTDHLDRAEYRYIDLLDVFAQQGSAFQMEELFAAPNRNHYSPLANKLVAQAVWQYLQREGLLDQDKGSLFK